MSIEKLIDKVRDGIDEGIQAHAHEKPCEVCARLGILRLLLDEHELAEQIEGLRRQWHRTGEGSGELAGLARQHGQAMKAAQEAIEAYGESE